MRRQASSHLLREDLGSAQSFIKTTKFFMTGCTFLGLKKAIVAATTIPSVRLSLVKNTHFLVTISETSFLTWLEELLLVISFTSNVVLIIR